MIPASHINFRGEVALWEAAEDGPRLVWLAATDAVHALQVDPDRWTLPEKPGGPLPVKPIEPEPEPHTENRPSSALGGEIEQ